MVAVGAESTATASSAASSSQIAAPAAPVRLENTTACLPIVTGSCAFYLGKKADEYQTHQWTLYLRGANNEDLSAAISKVVFQLHASFAQPVRELSEPPYEVTERGWGEFEAQIRILWKDSTEQATVIAQPIKLYPPGTPANTIPTDTETPVVSESYDEVVFTNPTETFFEQLKSVATAPTVKYSQEEHFLKYSDTEDIKALLEAQKFLKNELVSAKERLMQVDTDLARVDDALRQQQEQRKKAAAANAAKKNAAAAAAAAAAAPAPSRAKAAARPASTGPTSKGGAGKGAGKATGKSATGKVPSGKVASGKVPSSKAPARPSSKAQARPASKALASKAPASKKAKTSASASAASKPPPS